MTSGVRFQRFAAIDWSGAKGCRHKGIAVAVCEASGGGPWLVQREKPWSRTELLEWLLQSAEEAPTLFGFDFSFAPPIVERGEYLPGEPEVPKTAREFWAYVDRRCDDEDLGAASFLEQAHRRLGFSHAQMEQWIVAAGLQLEAVEDLSSAGAQGGLTVTIWTGVDRRSEATKTISGEAAL